MNICDLNEYVLIKIFNYCNNTDLENLCTVCRLFQHIVDRVFCTRSKYILMTGHDSNIDRNCETLSYKERLIINNNWKLGKYREKSLFRRRWFFPTKIAIDKKYFYRSDRSQIYVYPRSKRDIIERRHCKVINTSSLSDIIDFSKKKDTIFAGRGQGLAFIHEDDEVIEQRLHSVKDDISAVDFSNDIFITCSSKYCKIWKKVVELGFISLEQQARYLVYYKSINVTNFGKAFGGKYDGPRALHEIDLETCAIEVLGSKTVSIYDIKVKDENILFTGNFDSTLRVFDRRTNNDEAQWMDPFDSSIYCLEYDGLYAIVAGLKYHARVNLYDIRNTKDHIQMYFPSVQSSYGLRSPVYSVTCDCRNLYLATDHDVRIMDFKASYAIKKDYRDIFPRKIVIDLKDYYPIRIA